MSATTKIWTNAVAPTCEDDDLNGFKTENNNLIIGSGQSLDTGDNQQTNKAVAHYAGVGDFYVDSGAANAYVLSVTGAQIAPPAYATGMRIRFVPGNTNTGASTVNVAGLGVKALINDVTGAVLAVEDIPAGAETRAYYDGVDFRVTIVRIKANWTSATPVGTGLTISGNGDAALAALNGTDVAFIDEANDSLRTYRFNGSTWAQVGSGLAVSSTDPALAALSATDVAFIEGGGRTLTTYRFNGSTWAQVGSGLAITGVAGPALAALNGTDVAFIDGANDSLRTYRFNGSTWSLVGSGLIISSTSGAALAALNGTDVAFFDEANESLRTYRFNGSTWSLVGSGLAITGFIGGPALAALNGTDVAFFDSINDSLTTYRFNGSTWSLVGSGLAITGAISPALAALNGTDVAFIDSINDSLSTYRFGFGIE